MIVGVVPVRNSLALARLGERSLLGHALHAVAAVADRAVVLVDPPLLARVRVALAAEAPGTRVLEVDPQRGPAEDAVSGSDRLLMHDPGCPLLAAGDIRHVLAAGGRAAIGVRPVTDTVKTLERRDGTAFVDATIDRSELRSVCSPLVLTAAAAEAVRADAGPAWWTTDPWELVRLLRRHGPVELVEVAALGRRVSDEAGVRLLAAQAVRMGPLPPS